MNSKPTFSDDELTAYLDNEADYARIELINEALRHDMDLRQRLDALRIDRQGLSEALAPLLGAAPKYPLQGSPNDQTTRAKQPPTTSHKPGFNFSWRPALAMSMVLVLLGVGIGWAGNRYWAPVNESQWRYYAAVYQALYINSTLSHLERPEDQLHSELKRVSAVLGKSLSLDKLAISESLEYKRAQVLGYEGQPLIQLAFLSSVDAPVALCIMRTPPADQRASDGDTPHTEVRLTEMEGMSAAIWERGGFSYLLIGGNDDMLIGDIAHQFANTI